VSDSGVAERLAAVRRRIQTAAQSSGRDPAEVRLLAVSKRQPLEKMREAYAAGQRDFGENYAQELVQKHQALSDLPDLRLHMIGHVQTNKLNKLVVAASAIHSVDSARLASELGKRAAGHPVPAGKSLGPSGRLQVFIEVNVSGEAQKSGCPPHELAAVIDAVRSQPALGNDPESSRAPFQALAALRAQHGGTSALPELSLGMSRDLEVAIACGSTCVRVGTDIFGARG
jgi:pyridoxal phosphate enzyme (YggS family)